MNKKQLSVKQEAEQLIASIFQDRIKTLMHCSDINYRKELKRMAPEFKRLQKLRQLEQV